MVKINEYICFSEFHKQTREKENIIDKAFYFQSNSQMCYNATYIPLVERKNSDFVCVIHELQ
jgi:hypothetical protein